MATILDPLDGQQQELNLQDDEELVSLFDEEPAEETQATGQKQEEEETKQESTIPEKYRNKPVEEIVRMHQEAEKLLGRQSSEVGELRRIVDDFIKTKVNEAKKESVNNDSDTEIDFFDNPREAVNKAISSSEEIQQMKELLAHQKQQEVLSKISATHPDYVEIVQDASFIDWVKGSPVRVELLQRADKYDFYAANELLSSWKERKDFVSKAKQVNEKDRKQQIKAASTGGKGSAEPPSRKIYKRSDIVNLMIKDPERYRANVDEFDRAYREGRVK
jgi:hypothetical protein